MLKHSSVFITDDVESEDDDDSSPSETAGNSRMTQRQAALAGVVSATEHVSLGWCTSVLLYCWANGNIL